MWGIDPEFRLYRVMNTLRHMYLVFFIGWIVGCTAGLVLIVGGWRSAGVQMLIWQTIVSGCLQALTMLAMAGIRRKIQKLY